MLMNTCERFTGVYSSLGKCRHRRGTGSRWNHLLADSRNPSNCGLEVQPLVSRSQNRTKGSSVERMLENSEYTAADETKPPLALHSLGSRQTTIDSPFVSITFGLKHTKCPTPKVFQVR